MTKYVISGYIGFDNFGDEAIAKVLTSHLKKLDAEKIICSCHTDNIPSAKLQQSCGLKFSHSEMVTRPKMV